MTKLILLEFNAADGVLLPGLLFEARQATKKIALYLHGNGSSSVFIA